MRGAGESARGRGGRGPKLELEAGCGADRLTTHASITARPFFEHRGYRVLYAQTVERHGVTMQNFVMEKPNAVR